MKHEKEKMKLWNEWKQNGSFRRASHEEMKEMKHENEKM